MPTNAFECSSFGEGNILFSIFQNDAGHCASFCPDCILLSVLLSLCEIPTKFIFWKPVVVKLYLDLCVRFCLIYLMAKIKQFYLQDEPLTCRADIIRTGISSYGCTWIRKDHCCIQVPLPEPTPSCSWDHLSPGLQESPEPCRNATALFLTESHTCFFTSFLSLNDGTFPGKDV